MAAWGRGDEGAGGMDYKERQKKLSGGDILYTILIVVIGSWVYTYVKTHQTEHFKYVQFTVCANYTSIKLLCICKTMLGSTKMFRRDSEKKEFRRNPEKA